MIGAEKPKAEKTMAESFGAEKSRGRNRLGSKCPKIVMPVSENDEN